PSNRAGAALSQADLGRRVNRRTRPLAGARTISAADRIERIRKPTYAGANRSAAAEVRILRQEWFIDRTGSDGWKY
ncbi:MAG: hypothetical protein OXU81_02575, partial [Gammaproteobacteria bacterium]|nr:hypothetical protein [Gammaproteobacteria bacterium]